MREEGGERVAAPRASRPKGSPRQASEEEFRRPAVRPRHADKPNPASEEIGEPRDPDAAPVEDTAEDEQTVVCDRLEEMQGMIEQIDALLDGTEGSLDDATRDEMLLRRKNLVETHEFQRIIAETNGISCR